MKSEESGFAGEKYRELEFTEGPRGDSQLHGSDEGVRLKDCSQRGNFSPQSLRGGVVLRKVDI